jgi:hypothetical protein
MSVPISDEELPAIREFLLQQALEAAMQMAHEYREHLEFAEALLRDVLREWRDGR